MRTCLKMGFGITVCPQVSIINELEAGVLSQVNCSELDETTSVLMIWHAQKWCSPVLKKFMDMSQSVIR